MRYRFVVALSLLAVVAACTIDNPSNRFAEITYAHLPDIGLDVGTIEIERAYIGTGQAPNVEYRFPVRPSDAAAKWAEDRLVARGDRLTFRYVVRQASAIETELPKTTGVTGLITTDQSERYETHIMVEMQVLDGRQLQGTASAEARRSVTVPEDISLNERERVWYRLTEDTMNDLNDQLEETIKKAFFPYIVL
ncbi:MAG: hypothetical protein RH942_09900 [Kiloniellaceae bacterium]